MTPLQLQAIRDSLKASKGPLWTFLVLHFCLELKVKQYTCFYTSSLAQTEAGYVPCNVCHHHCHNIREYNSLMIFQTLALNGSPSYITVRITGVIINVTACHLFACVLCTQAWRSSMNLLIILATQSENSITRAIPDPRDYISQDPGRQHGSPQIFQMKRLE